MQVQQMIQASANVLTITRLSPGDVYKRVDDGPYGSAAATLRFGIIQSAMNNGVDSAVSALEYVPGYSGAVSVETKVFNGSQSVAIFPATPDEVRTHIDDLVGRADKALADAEAALVKARETRAAVAHVVAQVGDLSSPETRVGVIDAPAETPQAGEPDPGI